MADDHLHKQHRGWLLPYLLALDITDNPEKKFRGHGRWDYWLDACARCAVPEADIPQVHFTMQPDPASAKHVQDVLRIYVQKTGYWYDDAWLILVRWLLHGFGRRDLDDDLERIPPEIRNIWYEQVNLGILLQSPIDWSAHILQGGLPAMRSGRHKWASSTGFYSTPIDVVTMMTRMLYADVDPDEAKLMTLCDPCCGTGSMLLPASNHSLRLYGTDIVYDLCLCTELNGWLWIPWLVHMPPEMTHLFEVLRDEPAPSPPLIRLETNPARVQATQAYRAGHLTQPDFLAALGLE